MWQSSWQKMKRRPQLALVAAGGICVLIVAILAPVVDSQLRAQLRPPVFAHAASAALATPSATVRPSGTFFPASPHVHSAWGDNTALVTWDEIQGATGYVVTLIRNRDLGIMERYTVPAAQRAGDAQGVWPNESYQVAIQPLRANGTAGDPEYSAPGQSVPISRATYNGFLDSMNLAQGSLDSNLWDIRQFVPNGASGSSSATFINNQLHGHLETGNIYVEQSMVGMTARTPVDFTNRTAHIHGEVDLHGDAGTWFAVNLTPVMIGPNQMIDTDDRQFAGRSLPILTLFDGQPGINGSHGDLKLYEDVGGGQKPQQVVADMVPDFSYNNVRNTVDLYVSTTHVKVVVDGQTLADVALPEALPFSVAYLNLSAESYPKVAFDANHGVVPACDQVGGACNVWHLDNWGFDAPAASHVQPQTSVTFAQGCTPAPSVPDQLTNDPACAKQGLPGTSAIATYHLPVADVANTASAQVLAQSYSYDLTAMQHVQVSVNGGAWTPMQFLDTAQPYAELGSATIPAALLKTGDNVVQFRTTQIGTSFPGTQLANVELQQVRTTAYSPPALPPELAPLGTWNGSGTTPPPTGTPATTPPTGTPPTSLNNTPCTITINGIQKTGTCTGTFMPGK